MNSLYHAMLVDVNKCHDAKKHQNVSKIHEVNWHKDVRKSQNVRKNQVVRKQMNIRKHPDFRRLPCFRKDNNNVRKQESPAKLTRQDNMLRRRCSQATSLPSIQEEEGTLQPRQLLQQLGEILQDPEEVLQQPGNPCDETKGQRGRRIGQGKDKRRWIHRLWAKLRQSRYINI